LRLTQQIAFPPNGVGTDRDAAAAFRVALPGAVRDAITESQSVAYRMVDRQGRVYPLFPMTDPLYAGALKLPRGYASRPEGPRLEVTAFGRPLGSCVVDDLPQPVRTPLVATPSPLVGLVYEGGGTLRVVAQRPIPTDERWNIATRRTCYAEHVEAFAQIPLRARSRWSYDRLSLPYAEEAEAVELDVSRYRLRRSSMTMTIPNLRLERRHGGTALIVDRTIVVPNPMGANVRVPRQYVGPHGPVRHGDSRTATASITIVPPWQKGSESPSESHRERGPMVELLSPRPESLGLRALHIGGGVLQAKERPTGPLKEGPFAATVRVTFVRPVLIERRRNVVPVRIAPRPWPIVDSFRGGDPGTFAPRPWGA